MLISCLHIASPSVSDAQSYPSLLSFSASFPHLTTLNLGMEADLGSNGDKQILLASRQFFSNTFPHLRHLTLSMFNELDKSALVHFLQRHPDLRSFMCDSGGPKKPVFTDDTLPHVSRLTGDARILSALCDAWKEPRSNVLQLKVESTGKTEHFTKHILPKLPGLVDLHVQGRREISPEWLSAIAKACPRLKYLEVEESVWEGLLVRLNIHHHRCLTGSECLHH